MVTLLAVAAAFIGGAAAPPAPAGPPAHRRRVVIVSGEYEYSSMLTLQGLAEQLKADPSLDPIVLRRAPDERIPGLEAVASADLLITFIRRMTLEPDQLAIIRHYLESGRPLVALRTSCHAFQNWPTFGHDVLGGNYHDHYRANFRAVEHTNPAEQGSPLLAGIPAEFPSPGTLYKLSPLAPDTHLLLSARVEVSEPRPPPPSTALAIQAGGGGARPPGAPGPTASSSELAATAAITEPVAWTRMYHGSRIFFAALGDPGDFQAQPFMSLLGNAIGWALQDPALSARLALHPLSLLPAHALTPEEFAQFATFPSFVTLDLRSPAEFAAGHVKRAVNFDPAGPDLDRRIHALDPAHWYLVYADTAGAAAAVADRLHDAGANIVHYLGAAYVLPELRIGLIGTDTTHVIAFAKLLNDPAAPGHLAGARITAAFKAFSPDVEASRSRVDGFARQLEQTYGVKFYPTIEDVAKNVDALMILNVDGRPHLAEFRRLLPFRKPVFIDKPVTTSVADAVELYRLAREGHVPCFSASDERFTPEMAGLEQAKIGRQVSVFAYGPGDEEPHHPDLYWYGIHAVEKMYTLMGPGCVAVERTSTADADIVTGRWKDGRVGIVQATRNTRHVYGAMAFGTTGIARGEPPTGVYGDLVAEILKFYRSGIAPVKPEETIEILAFMSAADLSKARGGASVKLSEVYP